MQQLEILNARGLKEVYKLLKDQFDCKFDFPVVMKSSKDKIYLINRDVSNIDLIKLKIDVMGMYFGEIKHGELRLSIEGSQLIGPISKRNVLEISDKLARLWLKGYDIPVETDMKGFLLIKNKNDFLGCGKFKENRIFNFVPKARRILAND